MRLSPKKTRMHSDGTLRMLYVKVFGCMFGSYLCSVKQTVIENLNDNFANVFFLLNNMNTLCQPE